MSDLIEDCLKEDDGGLKEGGLEEIHLDDDEDGNNKRFERVTW